MFGLSIGFLVGYAVARWFGDSVKSIAQHIYAEVGKILEEWA